VANDLQAAAARLTESQRTAQLYRDQVIPAAQRNVESARAGYTAGGVDFLRLIDAERQLIMLREQQVEAVGDYHRALAELQQAVGLRSLR
jgi:outer membrane protein TolC